MNIFYFTILLLVALPSLAALLILFRRRGGQESNPLVFFLMSITIWLLSYAFHWLAQSPASKTFWMVVIYVAVAVIPAAYVMLAFQYSGRQKWLTPSIIGPLMIEPLLTLIILATDAQTGWFFSESHDPLGSTVLSGGIYFWFHVIYSYILALVSIVMLVRFASRSKQFYKFQLFFISSLAFPWLVHLLDLFKLTPWPYLDLTPFAFSIAAGVILYDLCGLRLLDIIPIARDILVDNMPDGLFVLDTTNRLVDFNPVARNKPITPEALVIGGKIESIFTRWPEVTEQLAQATEAINLEICMREDPPSYIDLRIAPLYNHRDELLGRLFTWRDITERKKTEMNLYEVNQKLHTRIDEIQKLQLKLAEQALRDGLTGVYNRRYLAGVSGSASTCSTV